MKIKTIILAAILASTSTSAFAMFGNPIEEKVPHWDCSTSITFKNGETRSYELNTHNIMSTAVRVDHQWTLNGKADSTGGKLLAKIYDLNGRGEIIYYTPNGDEFGRGSLECKM